MLVKIEGVMIAPEKGKLPTGKGTGKYIDGTGRFKGIQGTVSFNVTVLKPFAGESKGDALVEVTSNYTLPAHCLRKHHQRILVQGQETLCQCP